MSAKADEAARAALRRGCCFLAAAQAPDGFWRDYSLPPGASSDWVTAFVGFAMAGAGSPLDHGESLGRAISAVRSSCRPSGWGYNATVATDADTTSWVVRWFARARATLPIEPISCLSAYLGPGGGARTFACGPRYGRWTAEHVDVTAVLGLAMQESGASASSLECLRHWALGQRNTDGLWTSFWWTFDDYATARMLEFLLATGGIPPEVLEAARCSVEKVRTESPTPMEAANLLTVAMRTGVEPSLWIGALLELQQSDGGWPPSRVLRVPGQKMASGTEPAFEDGNGLFSTAMAVMSLTELLENDREHA